VVESLTSGSYNEDGRERQLSQRAGTLADAVASASAGEAGIGVNAPRVLLNYRQR